MSRIILINSNDNNSFAALKNEADVKVSYAKDFIAEEKNKLSKQPDKLIDCLGKVRDMAGNSYLQAEAVAVTIGPGSFTGIRVGISIAKGISFALGIKIIPVDNFQLNFRRIPNINTVHTYCILLPAKLPEYYFSIIEQNTERENGCLRIEEIITKLSTNTVIAGNFSDETLGKLDYFETLNVNDFGSELDSMFKIADEKFRTGKVSDPENIEPLYLKETIYRKV